MARLPALIDLLVSFGGVERRTFELMARVLREDGLLTQGKRGVGAAHVTARDAATLLLATMATNSPSAAPDVVRSFLAAQPDHRRLSASSALDREYQPLRSANNALEALERLLSAPAMLFTPLRSLKMADEKSFCFRTIDIILHRSSTNFRIKAHDHFQDRNKQTASYHPVLAFDGEWWLTNAGDSTTPVSIRRLETVAYPTAAINAVRGLVWTEYRQT